VALKSLTGPIWDLYEDVKNKALVRIEYMGLQNQDEITKPGKPFYQDPVGYAIDRLCYYMCSKCKKPYFGGERQCVVAAAAPEDRFNPDELVCGGCIPGSSEQNCSKHGKDFLEYKCRYCCSVAVWFCFGTTHFCEPCHQDFSRLQNMPKQDLPVCPAGPKATKLPAGAECPLFIEHPPTGEEFALGCGVCRNARTF